jgi:CRISPR-associated protein Cmr6
VDSEVGGDLIIFHDALYVPNSPTGSTPFGVDVVTSHQRSYYGETQGWTEPGRNWSNDYDSPSPVGFISVKPGARFLLAVDGDTGCRKLALDLLIIAIREWGVGSKTSAGYGRGGESG